MEIIGDVITIILLGVIFFYQKHKIGSLETQIRSQKGVLENAESFFRLFDLEKLKGYEEILAEKARVQADVNIKQIQADLEGALTKHDDFKEKANILSKEYLVLFKVFFKSFPYFSSETKEKLIDGIDQGMTRDIIKEANETFEKELKKAKREAIKLPFLKTMGKRKDELKDK
jgi:hypothetical protein